MPLYACESCGFTSAAFRPEAARAHRAENPDCEGVIRIIFRSEDRFRALEYTAPAGSAAAPAGSAAAPGGSAAAPADPQEGQAPADQSFAIREAVDPDQAVRLTLVGNLDLGTADVLAARLAELKAAGSRTRLDLSELAFIDSAGIQALLVALTDARWVGWPLEVAPEVSPSVQRAAEIVGIAQVLWPEDPDQSRRSPSAQP